MCYTLRMIPMLAAVVLSLGGYARAGDGRVKVYILAGQSNMEGKGRVEPGYNNVNGAIGSLRYMVNTDPANYGQLVDAGGNWVVRNDVYIWSTTADNNAVEKGNLTVGFGTGDFFGPELGFGTVVGNSNDDQVLLIKTAWGGKSLAVDFRPPSSGGTVGPYYTEMINDVNSVLANMATVLPGYHGQGIELVGFGWHQGWNDRVSSTYVAEYEKNMANFIRDVRTDLSAPNLPFVIAATGQGGTLTGDALKLLQAQMAMADPSKYPAFAGNVAAVDTRGFWRAADVSPADQGYHWNGNGETYYLIGDSMGDAINALNPAPAIYYPMGDLNRDEKLDAGDWRVFIGNSQKDLSGLTAQQAYLKGDLDGDLDNDIDDFSLFRKVYETANGQGAFAAMVASIPEPGSILLLACGAAGLAARRRRSSRTVLALAAALVAVWAAGGPARADGPVIYEPFDYPAGGLNGKSGTSEIGLTGTWTGSSSAFVVANSLTYGWLPTIGGSIGNLNGGSNNFVGARAISPSALGGNGLLADGATLWFSLEMGYDVGGNMTNSRLAFALANSQFNAGNYKYYINDEGTQLGSGLGVTLGRFTVNGNARNGFLVATQFRDASFGTSGFAGNVFGTTTANPTLATAGVPGLVVGKIMWGASSDTIEIYQPDANLNLGSVISTLTVSVPQSTYDTITLTRGDKVVADEIRFGATYEDVLGGKSDLTLRVDPVTGNTSVVGSPVRSVSINYYQVTSAAHSLDSANWTSLADQDFEGNGPPNGTGNGWEEAGGAGSGALAEAYLLGDSTIGKSQLVSLGKGYNPGVGAKDLVFKYRTDSGRVLDGLVEYVTSVMPGDANLDGVVDAADFIALKRNFGKASGATYQAGLQILSGALNPGEAPATIPEPASLSLMGIAGLALLRRGCAKLSPRKTTSGSSDETNSPVRTGICE